MATKKENWEKALKIAEIILPIYNRQLFSGYPTACIDNLRWSMEDPSGFMWGVTSPELLPIGVATAVSCGADVYESVFSLLAAVNMEIATNSQQDDCLLVGARNTLMHLNDIIDNDPPRDDPDDDHLVNLSFDAWANIAATQNDPYLAAALIYAITVYMPLMEKPSLQEIAIQTILCAVMFDEAMSGEQRLEQEWDNTEIINQLKQLQ